MKFSVEASLLRNGINKILSVIDKKSSRPILSNCLFSLEGDILNLFATDLDISSKVVLKVQSDGKGKFCVNSKNISELLRELPDEVLEIELDQTDNLLKLSCPSINFSILVSSAEEYPEITFSNVENAEEYSLNSKDILNIINKTSYAMSTDETRLFLNGIFLQKNEGKLRAVAIDGHRLAMFDLQKNFETSKVLESGIILPKKGINELKKMAENYDTEITVYLSESFLVASVQNENYLSIRLIAREYPKYQTVIPNKSSFKAICDKSVLVNAVKRIKIFSNETTNGIKFVFKGDQIELMANNDTFGEGHEVIGSVYNGDDLEVSLNAKYIMETLSVLDDGKISLELNNSLSPVVIRSDMTPEFLGIIMPLRI
ncbi:MAG: DNA polymerase III subunit beta [Halobacteriovoraceae bacterium]|nr:DNA polymerase III subunit beta [Halobacteriovoraceae bacterium]